MTDREILKQIAGIIGIPEDAIEDLPVLIESIFNDYIKATAPTAVAMTEGLTIEGIKYG